MVGGCQVRFIMLLGYGSEFGERIRYRVHNGRQVKFWHDVWCGQQALHSLIPNIYLLERRHHAMVADYYRCVDGSIVWDFRFLRNLGGLILQVSRPSLSGIILSALGPHGVLARLCFWAPIGIPKTHYTR